MGDSRLKVFISSSPGELTDERDAASAAVRTLRLTPLMHELAARPQPEARSDVFVGVYWQRYGWRSEATAASAVEDEYLGVGNVPRLVYVKEPAPGTAARSWTTTVTAPSARSRARKTRPRRPSRSSARSDRATGPRESRSGHASASTPETRCGRLTDTRASRFTARPGSARQPT